LSSHPGGLLPRWRSSPAGGFAPRLAELGWTPRLEAAFAALERTDLIAARVAGVHRGRLELLSAAGVLSGMPSGRMAHAAETAADLPAVGDCGGPIASAALGRSGHAQRRGRGAGTGAGAGAGAGYAASRSAASSRIRPRRPSARDSIWRTRSGVMPSWRPISRSGVGSRPAIP
jgi:hypothetical protein